MLLLIDHVKFPVFGADGVIEDEINRLPFTSTARRRISTRVTLVEYHWIK